MLGFSHGAIAINSMIVRWRLRAKQGNDFKAAVALYGHCRDVGLYPEGSIPLLEIVGEKDRSFAQSCKDAGASTRGRIEVHILPGAHHAFDNAEFSGRSDPYGHDMYYSREATERARRLVGEFLARRLKAS